MCNAMLQPLAKSTRSEVEGTKPLLIQSPKFSKTLQGTTQALPDLSPSGVEIFYMLVPLMSQDSIRKGPRCKLKFTFVDCIPHFYDLVSKNLGSRLLWCSRGMLKLPLT
jgi:hypothetical protein